MKKLPLWVMLLMSINALSQAGMLDLTFNGQGYNQIKLTGGGNVTYALAIQSDGKIVTAGASSILNFDFAIIRYHPDGEIDSTFGVNGGVLEYFICGAQDKASDVVIQSDGKIVVGGTTSYNGAFFVIARYNSNGTQDSTFGSNGHIMVSFPFMYNTLKKIALQSDGKIVAVGQNATGTHNNQIGLFRCLPDGTPDSTFGVNGKVSTDLGVKTQVESFVLQPDGKMVVVGNQFYVLNSDYLLVRYNNDGSLDSTFGVNGVSIINILSVPYRFLSYDVTLQDDGKIIVAGHFSLNQDQGFAVARFLPDGSLDSLFGSQGITLIPFPLPAYGYSVVVDKKGKIVIAGGASSQCPNEGFALARVNSDGLIDNTFGINGKMSHYIGGGGCAFNIAVQNNNRLLVVGTSPSPNGTTHTIARFYNDDITVGDEHISALEVHIFPNPSYGSFIISCNSHFDLKNTTLQLYNLQGQIVLHQPVFDNVAQINTAHLAKGLYLLFVSDLKNSYTSKVIIK